MVTLIFEEAGMWHILVLVLRTHKELYRDTAISEATAITKLVVFLTNYRLQKVATV